MGCWQRARVRRTGGLRGGGVIAPAGEAANGVGGISRLSSGSEPARPSISESVSLSLFPTTAGCLSHRRNLMGRSLCRLLATPLGAAGNDLPEFFYPQFF